MVTEIPQQDWKNLFEAAIRYHRAAPWKGLTDGQLFGVVNPEDGQRGYCSVMGQMGDYIALGLYPGAEGFQSYQMVYSENPDDDPGETMYKQRCIIAAFESEDELDPEDRMLIESMNLEYEGPRVWPTFRSYRPGFLPWALDAEEVRFMTVAFEQALAIAAQTLTDPEALPEFKAGQETVLFRQEGENGWESAQLKPDSGVNFSPDIMGFDAEALQQSIAGLRSNSGIWLIQMFHLERPVMEEGDERPYFPKAIVFMEVATQRVLGMDAVKPWETVEETAATLIECMEHHSNRPEQLVVSSKEHYIFFKPFCKAASIELHLDPEMYIVPALKETLFGRMG
ncbi:MAG: hypothetical protein AAF570_05200 [Bacteroidota bacterium]